MKNKTLLFVAILSVFTLFQGCSKDELILNKEYLTVSDISHYCSLPSCNEPIEWEGQEVKVKGHIRNYMLDYAKSEGKFWLIDIRNGDHIEIYVDSSCIDTIFNKIEFNILKVCYITGTLQSYTMPTMFKCDVGCSILLNNVNDIYFK